MAAKREITNCDCTSNSTESFIFSQSGSYRPSSAYLYFLYKRGFHSLFKLSYDEVKKATSFAPYSPLQITNSACNNSLLHYPKVALAHLGLPRPAATPFATFAQVPSGATQDGSGERQKVVWISRQCSAGQQSPKPKMSTLRDGLGRGSSFCHLGPEMAL